MSSTPSPPNNGHDWHDRMDRFQRGVEHLLESQANQQQHLNRHDRLINHLLETQDTLQQAARELMKHQVLFADETRKAFAHVAAKLAELSDAQMLTEDRLNGLIAVVDDFIRRQHEQ